MNQAARILQTKVMRFSSFCLRFVLHFLETGIKISAKSESEMMNGWNERQMEGRMKRCKQGRRDLSVYSFLCHPINHIILACRCMENNLLVSRYHTPVHMHTFFTLIYIHRQNHSGTYFIFLYTSIHHVSSKNSHANFAQLY